MTKYVVELNEEDYQMIKDCHSKNPSLMKAMDEAKKQEKDKEITEDQLKSLEKDIQKATDDAVKKIDSMTAEKEKELLTV